MVGQCGGRQIRELRLPPEPELLNERAIALEIPLLQVVEEPAAPADELEEPAARVVILPMDAEVLGQLLDPLGEQRDLHLG